MLDDPLSPARAALNAERLRLAAEIAHYQRPISGCDVQFNHLLDLRHRIGRALAELDRPERVPTLRCP